MLVKTPESVMTGSMLLLFPMTFVSNIFADPKTMPGFMQTIVSLNPVTHLTNASRGLMQGDVLGKDVAWVLVASAIVTAVFAPIAGSANASATSLRAILVAFAVILYARLELSVDARASDKVPSTCCC